MTSARIKPLPVQKDDPDDYWNSSDLKRFDFNEDEDEEDSIEVIRWDGSTAKPIKPKTQQAPSNASHSITSPVNSTSSTSGASSARIKSARGSHFPPSPATLPSSGAPLTVQYKKTSDPKTIAEAVSTHSGGSSMNASNVAKLESEVFSLRRQLNQAKQQSALAPSRADTLLRLMTGETYVLEQYKSLQDKAELLDGALDRRDGNAIIAITLFMRDTLKRDIFSKELIKRPVAVDHYCAYLREADEIDELHETLSTLGRTEEAAMLKYRQCLNSTASSSPKIRVTTLRDCVKYYFDSDVRLNSETNAILEQVMLTERQAVIEDADKAAEKTGQVQVFKSHPRKDSVIFKSVVTTLYYCCYYHWGEGEGLLSSPTSIRNQHKVGEKQFLYTAIAALCRMRRWRELETLLTAPRTMFRSARLHAVIGFDKVVDVLSKNLAPPDALEKYCVEISDTTKRMEVAVKLKCHKVAIDTFVALRDRQKLLAYRNEIPPGNEYLRQHLENKARSQDIKWKN